MPSKRLASNNTDLNKLVAGHRETNGAIGPKKAIRYTARILMDQLSIFADLEGTPVSAGAKQTLSIPLLLRSVI